MRNISAADELATFDAAGSVPTGQRAAALLRAFGMAEPPTLGGREAALLDLYAEHFGGALDGTSSCPACGMDVELSLGIADLKASIAAAQPVEPLVVDGEHIDWCLPDESDLDAAAACADSDAAARMLVSRCVTGSGTAGGAVSERVREAVAERIVAADPYADVTFTLVCPGCAATWEAALEVAEFVWAAVQACAYRRLREVDALARCYGWSQTEILALPQSRRDAYLELVRDG